MKQMLLFIFFAALIAGRDAIAATGCTIDGKIRFNQSSQTLQICDTYWVDIMVAAQRGACSAADKGKQKFVSSELQYCDGTNWNSLNNCQTTSACSKAGQISYDGVQKSLAYCDGTFWNVAYGACNSTISCGVHKDSTSCSEDASCMWSGSSCDDNGMNTTPGGPGSPI